MKVFDLHNDLPTRGFSEEEVAAAYAAQTPHRIVSAFYTTQMRAPLAFINGYIKKYPVSQSRLYAVEDMGFVKGVSCIDAVCALPVLYAGICWNGENALGGGAGSSAGLSPLGEIALQKLTSAGITADTAHLNEKTFYQVCDRVAVPINSHTCLHSVCAHPRNLTNAQIRLILSRGGIIGLTLVAQFMGKPEAAATRADYVRQIDTFIQAFGINGLCIGTDFNGTDPVKGLSTYTEFALLADDLQGLGYTQQDINKIFFVHADNFFSKIGRGENKSA
ncbi:MAG: membrane dipeptidase [Firmicutes bacterium]|nr:membrane dipeptidase [Bacillota bacterium]